MTDWEYVFHVIDKEIKQLRLQVSRLEDFKLYIIDREKLQCDGRPKEAKSE